MTDQDGQMQKLLPHETEFLRCSKRRKLPHLPEQATTDFDVINGVELDEDLFLVCKH